MGYCYFIGSRPALQNYNKSERVYAATSRAHDDHPATSRVPASSYEHGAGEASPAAALRRARPEDHHHPSVMRKVKIKQELYV